MQINVLVVDDETTLGPNPRLATYQSIEGALSAVSANFQFRLHFAESGIDSIARLSQRKFDFVFLDAVLSDAWLAGTSHHELLSLISKFAPFALVTARFDDSSHERSSFAIRQGNCQCFMSWLDFRSFADNPGPLFSLIATSVARMNSLDSELSIGEDETITIVQISDIQAGGYPSASDRLEIQIIANSVLDRCGGKAPTFIVVAGDLAEKGLPSEFRGATEWITLFGQFLGFPAFPSSRCFVVPGNHDVCLPLLGSANVHYGSDPVTGKKSLTMTDTVSEASLMNFCFAPYCDSQKLISSGASFVLDDASSRMPLNWISSRFLHLGLIFYGFNSVWPLKARDLPDRSIGSLVLGELHTRLHGLRVEASKLNGHEPFVIGVSHHSPFSETSDRGIVNVDEFEKFVLGSGGTNLFMCGHVHKSSSREQDLAGKRVIASRSSTVTKRGAARPEDSNRGLNLIELKRAGGKVFECVVCAFEWRGEQLIPFQRVFSF